MLKPLYLLILLSLHVALGGLATTPYGEGGAFIQYTLNSYIVILRIQSSVVNVGDKAVPLPTSDLLYFDYPLNTSDQTVYGAQAWINNARHSYRIERDDHSPLLVIEDQKLPDTLKPNETIITGVEYIVGVNISKRLSSIIDFQVAEDPYELLDKAGGWRDLEGYANETITGATKIWNYTHPLVMLLVKYLTRSLASDKPLGYLLSILEWIQDNVDYSIRVPPRYPWEVIVEGAGDCDDQSNLIIALLRSQGVPSYLEIGYVFLHPDYRYSHVEASGYYSFEFRGGGGHGWVTAYIPPWGWIRVDPVLSSLGPLPRVAIKYALYYIQATVVVSRIFKGDYILETAEAIEEAKAEKLKLHIVIEVNAYSREE
ncbi:MAG: transglutaminase [Thermoprotei archaeon]|nr:MAG: transglutaminase [Thermoprotei archaeon]